MGADLQAGCGCASYSVSLCRSGSCISRALQRQLPQAAYRQPLERHLRCVRPVKHPSPILLLLLTACPIVFGHDWHACYRSLVLLIVQAHLQQLMCTAYRQLSVTVFLLLRRMVSCRYAAIFLHFTIIIISACHFCNV